MRLKNWFVAAGFILLSEAAGVIGALFTAPAIPGWYATLVKPALNPPSWIFGPVWTMLYALMGISAFLVWKRGIRKSEVRIALYIFGVQLVLNAVWSVIFFGMHSPGVALIDIILMWFAIVATITMFAKVSRPAAWLLAPYLLWVTFATYLNYSIWALN